MNTNWATVWSRKGANISQERHDPALEATLLSIKTAWQEREPDEEWSILVPEELVYLARYPEGFVLRLSGDANQITFLTAEMGALLAERLGFMKPA